MCVWSVLCCVGATDAAGHSKPTERLFMHMHGLKVLLFNASVVMPLNRYSPRVSSVVSQLYEHVEELTRKNKKEVETVDVASDDEVAEPEEAQPSEQSLMSTLFPVLGFSAQLVRVFVGNHTLEKALLVRADEMLGNVQTQSTLGEMSEFVEHLTVRLERMDVSLIDNIEWKEVTSPLVTLFATVKPSIECVMLH